MSEGNGNVLVTGATGFLGRRLCQRLTERGDRVVAVGRKAAEGPWSSFVEHDLATGSLHPDELRGVSTIYHLASRAHALSEPPHEVSVYNEIIVEGTRHLVEAALQAGVKRFVYFSSVKAMGEGNPSGSDPAPLDESNSPSPDSPYGQAKARAEQVVLGAGLPHAVVLRPVMVFGPGEKGNLPRMVEAVRRNRFPPLPETGNRRSMIHVDDVVEFSLRAADLPEAAGRTYILAGPDAPSTRELYDSIRKGLGLPPRAWSVPLFILQAAAGAGSLIGWIFRRRLPLDRDSLSKLTGSAWYSAARAERELQYRARCSVREWLQAGSPSA